MSVHSTQKRLMAPDITAMKKRQPIVALTAYHAHTAAIADRYCDFLLVGDSLGMVMHGYETTVPVPLELMIMHGRAVVRGARRALVVVDMPFGSYEESPAVAFRNCAKVMKETDCGAVKIEGGKRMAETIRYLVDRGIPVMAHIGLTPQSVNVIGGFKAQGRQRAEWAAIEADARAIAEAGAFAVVLEAITEPLGAAHHRIDPHSRPSASAPRSPATARSSSWRTCSASARACRASSRSSARSERSSRTPSAPTAEDVRTRAFPTPEHTYAMQDGTPTKAPRTVERVGATAGRATKKSKNTSSKA